MSRINPVSFTGQAYNVAPVKGPRAANFLTAIGGKGNDAGLVTMSTSLAVMVLRPLVIMFDKNSSMEERIYAASWIFALSAISLAAQAAVYKPFSKASEAVAKNLLKLKDAKAIAGAAECVKYLLYNAMAIGITYINSRYVGKVMDAITMKLMGKKFSKEPDKPLTDEQKAKEKKKDKWILGTVGALAAFIGLNVIGRKFGKGPIASDAIKKGYRATVDFLTKNSGAFRNFKTFVKAKMDKLGQWANRSGSKFGSKTWFAKQTEIGDGWILRNMLANMIVRPTIALLSGQPYVAFRCLVDEGLGAIIVKFGGDPIIKATKPLMNKLFKATPEVLKAMPAAEAGAIQKGIDIVTGQVVRNVGLLCIVLGFVNNFVSSRMTKILDKFNKNKKAPQEEQYQDFRKNFVPAASLSENNLQVAQAKSPTEWLSAIHQVPKTDNQNIAQIIRNFAANQSQVKSA